LLLEKLAESLKGEERQGTEAAWQRLVSFLAASLKVRPVRIEVLAVRPSRSWGELHGLYNPKQDHRPAKITVWMRTAQRHQVVAFRPLFPSFQEESSWGIWTWEMGGVALARMASML